MKKNDLPEDELFYWVVWLIIISIFLPFFNAAPVIILIWILFFVFIVPEKTGGRASKNVKTIELIFTNRRGIYRFNMETNELIGQVDYKTRKIIKSADEVRKEWEEEDKKHH